MLVDRFIENVPPQVPAGAIRWRLDSERGTTKVRNVKNGIAKRIYLIERQGGKASFTFGVFDTEADALTYYDFVKDLRTVLENGESSDEFPMPNLFGSGLYGSNAIFSRENYFIEVGIEQFSGTAGNPLPSLSRQAFRIVDETLTNVAAAAEAGDIVDMTLPLLLEALPEQVVVNDVVWERGARSLHNVVNGEAASLPWIAGERRARLYVALFELGRSSRSLRAGRSEQRDAGHGHACARGAGNRAGCSSPTSGVEGRANPCRFAQRGSRPLGAVAQPEYAAAQRAAVLPDFGMREARRFPGGKLDGPPRAASGRLFR